MKKNSVGKVPIYTRKSLKEAKSIPLAPIHDRSLSYLGTETSIKSDEVKLDLILKSPLLQTYKIIHDRSLFYLGTECLIGRPEKIREFESNQSTE